MKIIVKVKTQAKTESVERFEQPKLDLDNQNKTNDLVIYKVAVKEAPVAGQANKAIAKVLAKYFKTNLSNVTLLSGQTSKQKMFEIV